MKPDIYAIPLEELRTVPVTTLAAIYGCDQSTIHRQRHRKGVQFKGDPLPVGRPLKYDWSKLDPKLTVTENMALTGCANRCMVRAKWKTALTRLNG